MTNRKAILTEIRGYATKGAKQKLEPFTYDAGPLGSEDVEVAVEYCGLCHSDRRLTTTGACRNTRSFQATRLSAAWWHWASIRKV
jgi:Zn-dependent alcohol dehydrogenase